MLLGLNAEFTAWCFNTGHRIFTVDDGYKPAAVAITKNGEIIGRLMPSADRVTENLDEDTAKILVGKKNKPLLDSNGTRLDSDWQPRRIRLPHRAKGANWCRRRDLKAMPDRVTNELGYVWTNNYAVLRIKDDKIIKSIDNIADVIEADLGDWSVLTRLFESLVLGKEVHEKRLAMYVTDNSSLATYFGIYVV